MKLTAQEKQEVIKLVEGSELGVHQTLLRLGIAKSTFYKWYKAYLDKGMLGLEPSHPVIVGSGIPSLKVKKT